MNWDKSQSGNLILRHKKYSACLQKLKSGFNVIVEGKQIASGVSKDEAIEIAETHIANM